MSRVLKSDSFSLFYKQGAPYTIYRRLANYSATP